MCELVLVQQCVQQPGRTTLHSGATVSARRPPIRVRTACQCMGMHDYCQNPVFCNCRAPAAGIQPKLLVDLLWDKLPADPAGSLRGERFNHPVG